MLSVLRILLLAILLWNGDPAMAQDVKHHAKHAVELGWSYFQKGDVDTALKRFNQALILDPDFAPGYFGIAYVYSVQNKLDLAIKSYKKSIEKDPTHSDSYSNLGLALLYSNKPTEALPMLKRAVEIDPKNGDAQVNIALYYFGVGDYSAAWKHIHLAQENNAAVKPEFLRDLKGKMPEPKRAKKNGRYSNPAVEWDRPKAALFMAYGNLNFLGSCHVLWSASSSLLR